MTDEVRVLTAGRRMIGVTDDGWKSPRDDGDDEEPEAPVQRQAYVARPPNEMAHHQDAFRVYRDLGPDRSFARLHEELVKRWDQAPSDATIHAWSAKFGWKDRIDHAEREAARKERREERARMAKEGRRRRDKRLEITELARRGVLHALLDPVSGEPRDLLHMDPKQLQALVQLFKTAAESDRIDTGMVSGRHPLLGDEEETESGPVEIKVLGHEALQILDAFMEPPG